MLVVAVDLTLAPETPYPASMQDGNYAVRWLKHQGEGMERRSDERRRPRKLDGRAPRGAPRDAPARPALQRDPASRSAERGREHRYVIARSPISDPVARFKNAEKMKREGMMNNTKNYFVPWESIDEGNPQKILDRGEKVTLPPLHPAGRAGQQRDSADPDQILPRRTAKPAANAISRSSQAATTCGSYDPGPQTDRAHVMIAKAFIAKHLRALKKAA